MKLKYAGPKEIISPHGIDFKTGKDDKYVYIQPAIEIYNAIHHDYKLNTIYTHKIEKKSLSDEEILNQIIKLNPKLKNICEEEIIILENYLDDEISNVYQHKEYNDIEKDIYKKNLIIMKNYRLQRETNKIIYNHLIEIIVDDIFEHKIREINTPFNEKFWHIFQSIQGELSHHNKRSIGSKLITKHIDNEIVINLEINAI